MKRFSLFAALVLGAPSFATTPDPLGCLFGFATTAVDESEATGLVVDTYRRLLDQLGANRLGRDFLKKMIERDDPFSLPSKPTADVTNLQKKLGEFKKLVEARGWNTPERRVALLAELGRFAKAMNDGAEAQNKAIRHSQGDVPLQFDGKPIGVAASPDGRWIVSVTIKADQTPEHVVYDHDTGNTTTFPSQAGERGDRGYPTFSPKGDEVFYAADNGVIVRIPFANGKLDLAARRTLPGGHHHFLEDMKFSSDGKRLYATRASSYRDFFLYDLEKNTGVEIKRPAKYQSTASYSWEPVPGTHRLRLLANNSANEKQEVVTLEVADDGSTSIVGERTEWSKKDVAIMHRHPINGSLLRSTHRYIEKMDGTKGSPIYELNADDHELTNVVIHPTKPRALVVVHEHEADRYRLDWLDLDTHAVSGSFTVPGQWRQQFKFSADGRVLLGEKGEGEWLILNYRQRFGDD